MVTITIPLVAISKKNSSRIVKSKQGRMFIMPSSQYVAFEKACLKVINYSGKPITTPVNVDMKFYMSTRRRVDLVNLEESVLDVLTKAGVLDDDNRDIVATMDGSVVLYDKENPRIEITITDVENYNQWKEKDG